MELPILAMVLVLAAGAPQAPAPAWLKPAGHVDLQVTIAPARKGAPAGTIELAIDVTPAPGIHVYAPGSKDYIPVEVTLDVSPGVKASPAVFPPSEPFVFGELHETVQVYQKPFRIRQPLAVAREASLPRTITGQLRYQACTNVVCFPPESLPIAIALPARELPGAACADVRPRR